LKEESKETKKHSRAAAVPQQPRERQNRLRMPGKLDIDESRLAGTVVAVCAGHGNRPDALIEILHELQAQIGYVPEAATRQLAAALNLSRAEVHGVISFYHDFHRAPPGRHIVRVCRAEACQSVGCEALAEHAQAALGIGFGETRGDGKATLEAVYCLGNCALGPAVMIDGELHGRVDAPRFDALVRELG
jgi:formate dehydrogenase subunit gamma